MTQVVENSNCDDVMYGLGTQCDVQPGRFDENTNAAIDQIKAIRKEGVVSL